MPRDHYLPASVIGRFSADRTSSARERMVFVVRKGRKAAFLVKAAKIGFVHDLYEMAYPPFVGSDVRTVDQALNGYEPGLPFALDQLCQAAPMEATTWLRTLVPYI